MATVMGGIGKQVLGELGDVAKKTVEETGRAGFDIAKGVVGQGEKQAEEELVSTSNDPVQAVKQQANIKRQNGLQRVREELARYVNKKTQEDNQEEMVENRQEEVKKQEEGQRQESEKDMQIRQAQRSGGGTGEVLRKKG